MTGRHLLGRKPGRRLGGRRPADPFTALALDPHADLTDDDVRVAWRRIAAATHPDRGDGGDPERFAAAAAAYTELRTRYGRGEARAGLAVGKPGNTPATGVGVVARLRTGRPVRLSLRVLGAVAASVVSVLLAGRTAAAPALVTGIGTWLVLTARRDVGPARVGQPGSAPVATGRDGSAHQADQEPT